MSIHTDRAFAKAKKNRAAASVSYARWHTLMGLSKRELAELVCHYAARCTDSYDDTILSDDLLLGEINGELDNLKANGIL
jgi:hypothetical protein